MGGPTPSGKLLLKRDMFEPSPYDDNDHDYDDDGDGDPQHNNRSTGHMHILVLPMHSEAMASLPFQLFESS